MDIGALSKLNLTNFRNFNTKSFIFNKPLILFYGNNGVGKTNILEAISLIGKSNSFRKSEFEEIINNNGYNNFVIYSEFINNDIIQQIAISFDKNLNKKTTKINNQDISSSKKNEYKNYLTNFIAITPQIEQLFISGKSARREYLDKIVCELDNQHSTRLNKYHKLIKERINILQKYKNSNSKISFEKWLDIIETQIVECGIAIAFARIESLDFFNKAMMTFNSNFPKSLLKVIGDIEQQISTKPAVEIENYYLSMLKQNRQIDMESFKTKFGIHRCDFDAIFCNKNQSAQLSSTGEQKLIMIGITLARAKISATYKNQPTILIFDEVTSHLDEKRKNDLFCEIRDINLQAFFSATSISLLPVNFQNNDLIQLIEI